jgi:hypothetical protein
MAASEPAGDSVKPISRTITPDENGFIREHQQAAGRGGADDLKNSRATYFLSPWSHCGSENRTDYSQSRYEDKGGMKK